MVAPNTCLCESRSQAQPLKNSPQLLRLWRPAAQRNLRTSGRSWIHFALTGVPPSPPAALRPPPSLTPTFPRLHNRVRCIQRCFWNCFWYMDGLDFGVLSEMPNIRTKASHKLFKQQELFRDKLLSSYNEMVVVVTRMVNVCKNMRCYFKGTTGSPLAQFSLTFENDNDNGECGGIFVFTFLSIPAFEELACEIVQMVIAELNLKRLLVMELVSISDEKVAKTTGLHWSDEFYEGEFDDLSSFSLFSKETQEPVLPGLDSSRSGASSIQNKKQQDSWFT